MAYKILIVDDEPEMVQMLSRSLSRTCGLYVMQYHSYFAGTTVHQHYHEIRSVRASNDSGEICRN